MENQAIYYYRSPEGTNVGPSTLQDLKILHENGTIKNGTYVISLIERKWVTFSELSSLEKPASPTASIPANTNPSRETTPAASFPSSSQHTNNQETVSTGRLEKLIRFNNAVGVWLAKVITFGKLEPKNSESFQHAFTKTGMLQVCFVWLSTVILSLTIGLTISRSFGWIAIFPGFLAGFFFQYICYLFTETNTKLLTSVKIPLSSMLFPRLAAIVSLFLVIPCFAGMFIIPAYIPLFLALGITCYLIAWLCLHSDKFFTCVWENAEAQHEPIAFFQFFIRLFGITAHLSAPILLAGAILTVISTNIFVSSGSQDHASRDMSAVATSYYNTPSPYTASSFRSSSSYMDNMSGAGNTAESIGFLSILSIIFICFPVITYFTTCTFSLIPYILDSFRKLPVRKGKKSNGSE